MDGKFVAEEGPQKGSTLTLQNGLEWIIGRDPDLSQIVIADPAVSRKHLRVRVKGSGLAIENLSQTNPVLLNGVELHDEKPLEEGATVKIGNNLYRYYKEPSQEMNTMTTDSTPNPEKNEPERNSLFDEQLPAGKDALAEINYDVSDTGRWLLKVIGGPNTGAEFAMQASNTYTLGTDPSSCDIVFHDTSVSRQHARISVSENEQMSLEDLKSRNGTLVDGEPLKGRKTLPPNIVVSLGTSSFVVYDREGEMQTIISPLLPSIVKVLQKEEKAPPVDPVKAAADAAAARKIDEEKRTFDAKQAAEKSSHNFSKFLVSAILTGLLVVVGIGITTLFKGEPVQMEQQVDTNKVLGEIFAPFPSIRWSYSPTSGRLLLVGHVLTASDKNQLLYNLEGQRFIRTIDDSGVIIDEGVWMEINQLLSNNPNWKGITVQATAPGKFVLTGYLQTRKQAEALYQYMSENFRYLDSLERKVVVDEDVIQSATSILATLGVKNLAVQMSNGELTLSGSLPASQNQKFEEALKDLRSIPGVRLLKNYITELAPEATMVNISDKYAVTGYSDLGRGNISVVINGRILSKGDSLDGMTITKILPNGIFLIKDTTQYKIDFSK